MCIYTYSYSTIGSKHYLYFFQWINISFPQYLHEKSPVRSSSWHRLADAAPWRSALSRSSDGAEPFERHVLSVSAPWET